MTNLPSSAAPQVWTVRTKRCVSALLFLHLAAVVAAPMAVEPASILSHTVWSVFQPYLDVTYLNHGYRFFAPEPGPSHLIRYEMELSGGRKLQGYFPDAHTHRPRLLYHRYFMLSEHLGALTDVTPPPVALDACSRSFGRHLLQMHSGQRVRLYLVRHLLPHPDAFVKGQKLDDPALYREKLLGEYSLADSRTDTVRR